MKHTLPLFLFRERHHSSLPSQSVIHHAAVTVLPHLQAASPHSQFLCSTHCPCRKRLLRHSHALAVFRTLSLLLNLQWLPITQEQAHDGPVCGCGILLVAATQNFSGPFNVGTEDPPLFLCPPLCLSDFVLSQMSEQMLPLPGKCPLCLPPQVWVSTCLKLPQALCLLPSLQLLVYTTASRCALQAGPRLRRTCSPTGIQHLGGLPLLLNDWMSDDKKYLRRALLA